jgi:hypothetical protein
MDQQRTDGHVTIALLFATMATITAAAHLAVHRVPVRFMLLTSGPEAAADAGAIGEDPDVFTSP